MKIISITNFVKYEVFIFVGLAMAMGTLLKIFEVVSFSDDWFWFLAGVGLVIEGAIARAKQRKFDKKYKIVERTQE